MFGFVAATEQALAGRPEALDALAALGEASFSAKCPASPLHAAVETGDPAVLRALLGFGADPNVADRDGRRAT